MHAPAAPREFSGWILAVAPLFLSPFSPPPRKVFFVLCIVNRTMIHVRVHRCMLARPLSPMEYAETYLRVRARTASYCTLHTCGDRLATRALAMGTPATCQVSLTSESTTTGQASTDPTRSH
nr:unnamed protein product [Digitaria exilis]